MGKLEINIIPGEPVVYQGNKYVIKQLTGNLSTVILENVSNNTLTTAKVKDLLPFEEKIQNSAQFDALELFNDEQWAEAQRRLAIIRPILELPGDGKLLKKIAKENKIGTATLYRWIDSFNSNGQISSLIPNKPDGGKNKGRLNEELESIIKNSIAEVYLTTQKNPLKKVRHEILRRCKNLGIEPPASSTIRRRILSISEESRLRARYGRKAAEDFYRPITGHFPNADFPLSIVQIDHTSLDIILVDEIYRKPVGRPYITLAIDVYSRLITGLYISFDPPGMLGTGMCIVNSILPKESWLNNLEIDGEWPCWGRMNTIHLDNAKEFRGVMLAKACEEYGIDIQWRPVKTPNWGGHIERMLGTLLKEIQTLPGTTFSNPKQRGIYNSEGKAAFTLKEFEKWVVTFIVNVYHKRIHTSLGNSPLNVFEEGTFKRGLKPRIYNDYKIKLDFLPYVERSIQEYGVVIDHIHYYGDVMRKWIHAIEPNTLKSKVKRKFIFKRDPRDISIIYFFDPELKEYFKIPYRDTSRPPLTLWEHREIIGRLQKEGANEIDEDMIFSGYEKLKKIEDEAVSKTQKIKRIKKNSRTTNSKERSTNSQFMDAGETDVEISSPRLEFKNVSPYEDLDA